MGIIKFIVNLLKFEIDENLASSKYDLSNGLTVSPKFSADNLKRIEQEWMEAVPHYLQEWPKPEIVKLKSYIRSSVLAGTRIESMVGTIEENHKLTETMAKFIARQEATLFTVKLKQIRYEEAGVMQYKWTCVVGSPAHPVRPMHKALDGKIFSWDNPPIVNEKGEKKHPGEDEDCRCTARPIVKF